MWQQPDSNRFSIQSRWSGREHPYGYSPQHWRPTRGLWDAKYLGNKLMSYRVLGGINGIVGQNITIVGDREGDGGPQPRQGPERLFSSEDVRGTSFSINYSPQTPKNWGDVIVQSLNSFQGTNLQNIYIVKQSDNSLSQKDFDTCKTGGLKWPAPNYPSYSKI